MSASGEPTWGPSYKKNVMFLCNHNSCRSQMADGWLQSLRGSRSVGVASAGIVGGTAVKPGAITVMKEVGIDISGYSSDAMADFKPTDFDAVISCCGCGSKLDGENEAWKKRAVFVDWNLDDPPAIDPGDLSAYRRVRDEAKERVLKLLDDLAPKEPTWGPKYKKNVMFLCNHNSCRSQMADGWLQALRGDRSVGVASAGIVGGTAVKAGAITVMKEVGVDISAYSSDAMADFSPADFDAVISCCGCGSKLDGEREVWKQRALFVDWNLDDPPAIDPGDLSAYRRVRDEAKALVVKLLDELAPRAPTWGPMFKKNVMFLCNHNSCRSQMADGWLQSLRGDRSVGVASAGIVGGTAVKPGAITVMKEVGVDISAFSSDAMADFNPADFDAVISCCGCGSKLDGANEAWKKRAIFVDWNLDDPPAIDPGDLSAYRRVRDEAKERVVKLLDELAPREPTWGPKYKKNVMFLCNHNSCRSQMADGWLQFLRGDRSVGVASAGIVGGTAVKPGAITVMKEVGVDISAYASDAMADFNPADFDAVISCCGCGSKLDGENEAWKRRAIFVDWNLDDPPAIDPGDLSAYRRVRDEAKERVVKLLDELAPRGPTWGPKYRKNVMFLCNHNSCRSQMADGWLLSLRGERSVGVASAGIVGGTAVKPGAITVMKEVGVDISGFSSDAMADFSPADFDVVISCCGCGNKLDGDKEAWKQRPRFQDWNLDDPPAIDPGDLSAYRRVRDEAKARVMSLLDELEPGVAVEAEVVSPWFFGQALRCLAEMWDEGSSLPWWACWAPCVWSSSRRT